MRILKRPMFRKGGTTGGGIMDNVVERGQYAKSNADDLGVDTDKISLQDEIDAVMAAGGKSGLDDPLTQFLLQVGPNIAGQTGGGGLIPNLLLASKEPVSNLIKSRQAEKKTRQAIALDLFKDVDKDKATQFIRKAREIAKETGRDYQEVLNELYQTEIYRKKGDPTEMAKKDTVSIEDSIIGTTSSRFGVPKLDKIQASILVQNLKSLEQSNPDVYKDFVGQEGSIKYIFGNKEFDRATGIIKDKSKIRKLSDNFIIYDINTGTFLKKQGNTLIGLE